MLVAGAGVPARALLLAVADAAAAGADAGRDQGARASGGARSRCSKVGAERRTAARIGVLIYLSLAERRAEIVADDAIHAEVAAERWGEAMAALVAEVRDGRPGDGMAAAVAQIGAVLAEHFPQDRGRRNELPDRLIEL